MEPALWRGALRPPAGLRGRFRLSPVAFQKGKHLHALSVEECDSGAIICVGDTVAVVTAKSDLRLLHNSPDVPDEVLCVGIIRCA